MTIVKAYAAMEKNGKFEPYEYELEEIGPNDVDIAVESCGLCFSDVSMLEDEWGITKFPFVGGHEVIGKVKAVGDLIAHVSVGDRVGLGWHSGYCMHCDQCISGDHNLCSEGEPTIAGRFGGFADIVRARGISVVKLPDALDEKKAGPLLCGGITVFNPMIQTDLSPTASVGVIGIGGLGHLAVKFASSWGCRVTAFTSSEEKKKEALSFGAHETINSRDPVFIEAAAGKFDLLICTVNVNLDWDLFLKTLKPKGKLHMLGVIMDPVSVHLLPMIGKGLSFGATPVGSPENIRKMLDFAARHSISPVTQHFPMSQINEAFHLLKNGKAHYRIVLDR